MQKNLDGGVARESHLKNLSKKTADLMRQLHSAIAKHDPVESRRKWIDIEFKKRMTKQARPSVVMEQLMADAKDRDWSESLEDLKQLDHDLMTASTNLSDAVYAANQFLEKM